MRGLKTVRACAAGLIVALATSCSSGAKSSTGGKVNAQKVAAITAKAPFHATGSVHGAYVLGATNGETLILTGNNNREVARGTADSYGAFVFHDIVPGRGFTVRHVDGSKVEGTDAFNVLDERAPDPSLYQQTINPGLNYVKMRDGVELAMTLRLPAGKKMSDGPFPTVIEYSGYQVAAPKDLFADIAARLGNPNLPQDPLVPSSSTAVGSLIAPQIGYATVSVQMRGTGCSGGAFDLFDWATTYDGYDAVETVAAQSWVRHHKVGLVGISFSGISQLFVGGTRPPHLAAVAPLSVTDDLYRDVGSPGGMFNTGFAKSWLQERTDDAKPAPEGGQPWAKELVRQGDKHCIDNQKLHSQARDVFAILSNDPSRVPSLYDHREPAYWGAKIDVPVFMAVAFQDEQIIGTEPGLISALAKNPNAYITLMNGTHVDPLGPGTISRWAEFLGLYVADAPPTIPATVLGLGGALYQQIASAPAAPIAQSRFAGESEAQLDAARQKFREDPKVRLLMDIGGGKLGPGALEPVWELGYDTWPPAQVRATSFYLGPHGTLTTAPPTAQGSDSYMSDASARPELSLPANGNAWAAQPGYDWKPVADGHGLGYVSQPLTHDMIVAGPGSVDLMLASSARDTDLQVTLSEVRPDGKETYVQFGVLRASYRKLGPDSTDVWPVPTYLSADRADLPAGRATLVRVPLFPVAYAFRAGSRLRITIQAPGGERPAWKFDTIEHGSANNTISWSAAAPSKLVLDVVPGDAQAPLPACGATRGQPCRTFTAASNGG